jgi:hypothetical protein
VALDLLVTPIIYCRGKDENGCDCEESKHDSVTVTEKFLVWAAKRDGWREIADGRWLCPACCKRLADCLIEALNLGGHDANP